MLEFLLNVSRGPLQQLEVSHDDNAHFVLVCCPVANRSAHTWLWHRSTVIMPAAQSVEAFVKTCFEQQNRTLAGPCTSCVCAV